MKKISKKEVQKQIEDFFENIHEKTDKDIKKIKRLSMKHNIRLKEKRKLFCKKCLVPYKDPRIRINKSIKTVVCSKCGFVARWKMKN